MIDIHTIEVMADIRLKDYQSRMTKSKNGSREYFRWQGASGAISELIASVDKMVEIEARKQ